MNDADNSSILTREKWVKWHTRASHFRSEKHLDEDFKKISSSKFFRENFLNLPEEAQGKIVRRIMIGNDVPDLDAMYALRAKMKENFPKLNSGTADFDWYSSGDNICVWIIETDTKQPLKKTLQEEIDGFCEFNQLFLNTEVTSSSQNYESAAWMLTKLYGHDTVREVIQAWMKNDNPHSVRDFIFLVENWEAYRNYPLEWTFSLHISPIPAG